MEISLDKDFDNFIKEQMATGLYKSVNDIIKEALSLFKLRKSIPQEKIEEFNKEIQKGLDDIEAGKFSSGDEFFKKLIAKYE
ncbi:type II toxin-antitoxin system ParD family antitoxin [bacterium]|nr:type II toxin-antitoxin system ParD family antitoxin [bacterium]